MLHVEIKALRSQTALGYEIPGEYDSDYSKSGAYWNHINFKEYRYHEGTMLWLSDYGIPSDHLSGNTLFLWLFN